MSSKQLIIIALVSVLSLGIALVAGLLLLKYDPTIFGKLPSDKDEKKIYIVEPDDNLSISGKKLMELESSYEERLDLEKKYADLSNELEKIENKFESFKNNTEDKVKNAEKIEQDFESLKKSKAQLKDSIEFMKKKIKEQEERYISELEKTKDMINRLTGASDSLKGERFKAFAKIYNNAKPEEVAKILEKVTAKNTALILKLMSKKQAGKVVESLDKDYAAEVLLVYDI